MFVSAEELQHRIDNLRKERAELLKEVERLQVIGLNKVRDLEREVAELRNEIDDAKEFCDPDRSISNQYVMNELVERNNEVKKVRTFHKEKENVFYF